MQRARRALTISSGVSVLFCLSLLTDHVSVAARQTPDEATDAELSTASAGRTIRIGLASGRSVDLLLEVYVARVLAAEGEPRAADGAQQALAIAIRTFALANLNRHGRDGFDLCDTTHCQVMRTATAISRRATAATASQVLLYDGHPAELFYSASCGGRSELPSAVWPGVSDYPYLRVIDDDVHDEDQPWVLELTAQKLQQALRKAGFSGSRLKGIEIDGHTRSGRVAGLHLAGLHPDRIDGAAFRTAIGPTLLRSTAFTIVKTFEGYRFTGRGYGHGVGMCVIGAGRRALRGESAAEILAVYYPGLRLVALGSSTTERTITPLSSSAAARRQVSPSASVVAGPASPMAVSPMAVSPRAVSPMAAFPMAAARTSPVVVRIEADAIADGAALQRMANDAHDELSRAIGTSVAPVTIDVHASVDSFRQATGRPWWFSSAVKGSAIDLAPTAVLAQRDGIELAIRIAMAEALIGGTFDNRPAWLRIGAARYFARGATAARPAIPARLQCPSDAEVTKAVSVTAQRDADTRAEQCFVKAREGVDDWRAIR